MKKLTTLSILLISLAFVVPTQASAATGAGVTPGSFFYFFDTTFENIGLFFTFNPEQKARKALAYADERLSEIEAIAEEKNPDGVKTAIANYEGNIALATEKSKEIKDKGQAESLLTSISDNTAKNQEVLAAVLIKVPDEAKEAITRAIEASRKGQEEATKRITELESEVERLKKEVKELKKKQDTTTPEQSTPTTQNLREQKKPEEKSKTNMVTLPNGAIVEMGADGNIIRTIKEASAATSQSAQPAQSNNTKISSTALESELLKFLNEQLSQQTKSDLDYYQRTISDLQSLNQMQAGISSSGKQNCLTSYNSKVKYAKDDAQRQKTANAEAQRGFASSPAISQNIDAQLARDLEDIENWYNSCLAQYQADSSVSGRLSQVSSQLNSLRQRVNSGDTVSTSEVSAVGNEIVSISRALGEAAGVSGSVSLPSVGSRPSSITCTNDITGFSCRDNFGSNAMRCTQSTPGSLNCTDSNFNSVSCQSNSTMGSLRCSW